eukprot:3687090-Rhodomonas_salina.2
MQARAREGGVGPALPARVWWRSRGIRGRRPALRRRCTVDTCSNGTHTRRCSPARVSTTQSAPASQRFAHKHPREKHADANARTCPVSPRVVEKSGQSRHAESSEAPSPRRRPCPAPGVSEYVCHVSATPHREATTTYLRRLEVAWLARLAARALCGCAFRARLALLAVLNLGIEPTAVFVDHSIPCRAARQVEVAPGLHPHRPRNDWLDLVCPVADQAARALLAAVSIRIDDILARRTPLAGPQPCPCTSWRARSARARLSVPARQALDLERCLQVAALRQRGQLHKDPRPSFVHAARARTGLQHSVAVGRVDLARVVGQEEDRLQARERTAPGTRRAHHHLDGVRVDAPVDLLLQRIEQLQRDVERILPRNKARRSAFRDHHQRIRRAGGTVPVDGAVVSELEDRAVGLVSGGQPQLGVHQARALAELLARGEHPAARCSCVALEQHHERGLEPDADVTDEACALAFLDVVAPRAVKPAAHPPSLVRHELQRVATARWELSRPNPTRQHRGRMRQHWSMSFRKRAASGRAWRGSRRQHANAGGLAARARRLRRSQSPQTASAAFQNKRPRMARHRHRVRRSCSTAAPARDRCRRSSCSTRTTRTRCARRDTWRWRSARTRSPGPLP